MMNQKKYALAAFLASVFSESFSVACNLTLLFSMAKAVAASLMPWAKNKKTINCVDFASKNHY